jgi:hypothetical protein
MRARTTRERGRRARVSGFHAGSTCPRGRRLARALLGLGRRWAEREVEEEVDCGEEKSRPRVGEEEGSGPQGKEAG